MQETVRGFTCSDVFWLSLSGRPQSCFLGTLLCISGNTLASVLILLFLIHFRALGLWGFCLQGGHRWRLKLQCSGAAGPMKVWKRSQGNLDSYVKCISLPFGSPSGCC